MSDKFHFKLEREQAQGRPLSKADPATVIFLAAIAGMIFLAILFWPHKAHGAMTGVSTAITSFKSQVSSLPPLPTGVSSFKFQVSSAVTPGTGTLGTSSCTVRLAWNPSLGAVGYNIYRVDNWPAATALHFVGNTTNTNFTATVTVTNNVPVYFTLTAFNAAGIESGLGTHE